MAEYGYYAASSACTLPRSPLSERLDELGLCILGSFSPDASDRVPDRDDLAPVKTVLLIGNAGPQMWKRFQQEKQHESDPLDNWITRHITSVATDNGFDVLFPFQGPPFLPFQSWGEKAQAFFPSPGVPSIHPIYGSWFGLRAAFLCAEDCHNLSPAPFSENPCDTCLDRPCLQACPCHALSDDGYDAIQCIGYIKASPGYPCLKNGCRARHACPIGQDFAYGQAQAEFHMRGFMGVLEKPAPKIKMIKSE